MIYSKSGNSYLIKPTFTVAQILDVITEDVKVNFVDQDGNDFDWKKTGNESKGIIEIRPCHNRLSIRVWDEEK